MATKPITVTYYESHSSHTKGTECLFGSLGEAMASSLPEGYDYALIKHENTSYRINRGDTKWQESSLYSTTNSATP
jgi:hypothetical protein